ncbi:MAG TPA: MarR family winged helix-turn-helix transcriptional regulator [Byssovorax sp.]
MGPRAAPNPALASLGQINGAKVWALDYRLVASVIAGVGPAIAELGLEVKELLLLAEVEAFPHPAALAGRLCMPKPTVTVYVKRLEAAGLLERSIDPTDLRRHRLTMTAAGRRTVSRGVALLEGAFEERFGRLDHAEQAEFRRLLEKMG